MKKVFWAIGAVVLGAGLFGLGWISHSGAGKATDTLPSASYPNVGNTAPNNSTPHAPAPPALVSQSEFEQLRTARDAALQANPDLAAEYKQIISDMQAQQAKLDAALIKADPKVAPIVAKLVVLRQINTAHGLSTGPSPK